jgi:uncharacterized protein with von Willebrand factor type A (vWA) domain
MDEKSIGDILSQADQILDQATNWANELNELAGFQHAVAEIDEDGILIETRWNDGEIGRAYSFKPEHLVNAEAFAARWNALEAQRQAAEEQRRLENEAHEERKSRARHALGQLSRDEMESLLREQLDEIK